MVGRCFIGCVGNEGAGGTEGKDVEQEGTERTEWVRDWFQRDLGKDMTSDWLAVWIPLRARVRGRLASRTEAGSF